MFNWLSFGPRKHPPRHFTADTWRQCSEIFLLLTLPVIGCASPLRWGMEAPGRPGVTWQSGSVPAAEERREQNSSDAPAATQQSGEDLRGADTLFALAVDRRQQGDLVEAAKLYRQALEIREREQGPNHPDVAAVLNNLGGLEAAQGRYEAAQPLIERALSIRQTALGPEHVSTAESLSNLALLYAAEGKATAAESLYQRAIDIFEKKSGTERAPLDTVLDNYAALLHDTGRTAHAEEVEARARLIRATAEREPDLRR